jgi:hypothetical protein
VNQFRVEDDDKIPRALSAAVLDLSIGLSCHLGNVERLAGYLLVLYIHMSPSLLYIGHTCWCRDQAIYPYNTAV